LGIGIYNNLLLEGSIILAANVRKKGLPAPCCKLYTRSPNEYQRRGSTFFFFFYSKGEKSATNERSFSLLILKEKRIGE
jgi:hypothetical protein